MQRVTREYLESKIVSENYMQPAGTTLTLCLLGLDNGIVITGDAACLNPEDFNAEMGRKIARAEAINKMWLPEGYHRAEMERMMGG